MRVISQPLGPRTASSQFHGHAKVRHAGVVIDDPFGKFVCVIRQGFIMELTALP
jgi:hypothetical protein